MTDPRIARARLLYEQSRYDQAIGELSLYLGEHPDDVEAHCLKALCLKELEQYDEATEHAKQAIAAAPDWAYPHYVFSVVMADRNRLDAAQRAIEQAIALEPHAPDYFSQLASIQLRRQKWTPALEAADQALALDPENETASNLRSMALVKLNRTSQAADQIEEALRRDPDNPWTHANRGWAYLETREIDKALEHFREALRLDPTLEYARQGMIQALMARHFFYRIFLRYLLWMSKLSNQLQWAVIIGFLVVMRASRAAAEAMPALAPYVLVFRIVYILFAWFTWVAQPMFQLALRFNRFGRYALSRDETIGANLFAACMLAAAGLFTVAVTVGPLDLLLGSLNVLLVTMPVSAIFRCDAGAPRWLMGGYTLLLLGAAIGTTVAVLNDAWWDAWGSQLLTFFYLGIFGAGFVANGLMQWTPKK